MSAERQANRAHAYALETNTRDAWLVASDAAEEACDDRAVLAYRFFATVAPRSIHSGAEIVRGLRRIGAAELTPSGVRLDPPRRLHDLFQALATYFVGDGKTELYFLSNRDGIVFAIFSDRDDAIDRARHRDLYVEGPGGEEWRAPWA